jgi:glutamyl-tRNA synthetase
MSDTSATRVRFAPSPTGYLHVGGARTALFNWLWARKTGGTFVLRIEDTDLQRSSQEMVDVILNSMTWLGLNWDEGPFFQSDRISVYREAALKLVVNKKAYRCFCKPEELEARRQAAIKEKGSWKYERLCLALSNEEIDEKLRTGAPYAVRFLVPPGKTSFLDLIHGEIALDHGQVDDFVLLRSDHQPTYHLSVVVDDIDMAITHVIRGDDHISNTPKQILLYEAFEALPPEFGHLPLILGPDKKRLSKRHGSVAVEEYRNQGILPEALLNFLALLGWNPGDDREIMSREELVKEFDLRKVNSSNAVFDFKKLQWMNGKYLSMIAMDRLLDLLKPYLPDKSWPRDEAFISRVELMRTRAFSLVDLAQFLVPFYSMDFPYDPAAFEKFKKDPSVPELLERFLSELTAIVSWDKHAVENALRDFTEPGGIKAAVVIHPMRLALTGKPAGPGVFELVEAMGKENTIARLQRFVKEVRSAA